MIFQKCQHLKIDSFDCAQALLSRAAVKVRFLQRAQDTESEESCIFTLIQTPLEVSNDPQVLANNYFINVPHPVWGKIKMVGFPWDFSETPASWRREAPAFGQHSGEILSELGFTTDDIAHLKEEGVIQ